MFPGVMFCIILACLNNLPPACEGMLKFKNINLLFTHIGTNKVHWQSVLFEYSTL